MQHYFGSIKDDLASIDPNQLHHLLTVRRTNVGEKIEVSDGKDAYLCVVESLDPLRIAVLEKISHKRELDVALTIGFALLKGDHNDLIVLKCTELGVSEFIPLLSSRCIVKPDGRSDNKLLRLRKKAEEGAMQCRRDLVPSVNDYATYEEVLNTPADIKLFAYEGVFGSSEDLLSVCKDMPKGSRVLVLIGPEGGFSDEEAKAALDHGFRFVSLGRRILRAETAALYCASIIGAFAEEGR